MNYNIINQGSVDITIVGTALNDVSKIMEDK